MDRNTQDRESGRPMRDSKDELEEALKWLEELTNRQGKSPEQPSISVPSATADSPFHGLIESDEGDLPDWLREVPSASNPQGATETEPESRLDWLAKMAQRESIEELPTLEWRRIGEPIQSAILPPSRQGAIEGIAPKQMDEDKQTVPPFQRMEPPPIDEPPSWLLTPEEAAVYEADGEPVDESSDLEATAVSSDTGVEDEIPSPDDLDAAMAWIEELAASQDAPIEDIPSVVDRALASKLMMEAGLPDSVSPLDELGSDSAYSGNSTPTHPFIDEEDFADTIVLVETMAADQGLLVELPDEAKEAETGEGIEPGKETIPTSAVLDVEVEPLTIDDGVGLEEPLELLPDEFSEDASFEEAMAYLDEMAVKFESDSDSSDAIVEVDLRADDEISPNVEEVVAEAILIDRITETEVEPAEPPAADFTPWVEEEEIVETDFEVVVADIDLGVASTNGQAETSLESTLLALDALALPAGKTLDDIDLTLRTAHFTSFRDVSSALDWLESALEGKQVVAPPFEDELSGEELIARMPEDPEAVLAWLEQMAEEEEGTSDARLSSEEESVIFTTGLQPADSVVDEFAEADLLNMPDDPDEAMAWLESLARGEVIAAKEHPAVELEQPLYIDNAIHSTRDDEVILHDIDAGETGDGAIEVKTEWSEPVNFEEVEFMPEVIHSAASETITIDEPLPDRIPENEMTVEAVEIESVQTETMTVEEVASDLILASTETLMVDARHDEAAADDQVQLDGPAIAMLEKPKRRRTKKATKDQIDPAFVEEDATPPPTIKGQIELSWIDLLKPLE